MKVYTITLILVCILGILEYQRRTEENNLIRRDYTKVKASQIYLFVIIAIFLFVGGLRFKVGSDYVAYASSYTASFNEIKQKFLMFDEPIIYVITDLARKLWNEGIFVIFVENALTVLLVFKGIKSYEQKSYVLPLCLYIMYCGWTSSFNGVRQSLAVAFIFAFSKRGEGKCWILKYIIVGFIAFLIHKSALFMIPILLLANRKIDFKQIIYILIAALVIPKLGVYALDFMNTSLDTEYASHSVNMLRVLVAIMPAILSICCGKKFREENTFLVNMAVFNALITITTRNSALMYRFSDFTNIYLMLLIPKCEIKFTNNSRWVYKAMVIILFYIYFLHEVSSGNGNLNNFQWAFGNFGRY